MTAIIRQIEDISSESVIFYTVLLEDKQITEYQDFQRRMNKLCPVELKEVNLFIRDNITENYNGAEARFFKKQVDADRLRLPTPDEFDKSMQDPKDYGLRLYAVRLSERTVFLLNGDKKRYSWAQNCPNCSGHFELANKIANAIDVAKYNYEIEIDDEGYILTNEDFKLNIL